MKLEDHERISQVLFGNPFTALHRWLDDFAGKPGIGMRHRQFRHHQAGIEEAVCQFGEGARQPARRHIWDDLALEGWVEGRDPFPRDREDYRRMGLF